MTGETIKSGQKSRIRLDPPRIRPGSVSQTCPDPPRIRPGTPRAQAPYRCKSAEAACQKKRFRAHGGRELLLVSSLLPSPSPAMPVRRWRIRKKSKAPQLKKNANKRKRKNALVELNSLAEELGVSTMTLASSGPRVQKFMRKLESRCHTDAKIQETNLENLAGHLDGQLSDQPAGQPTGWSTGRPCLGMASHGRPSDLVCRSCLQVQVRPNFPASISGQIFRLLSDRP